MRRIAFLLFFSFSAILPVKASENENLDVPDTTVREVENDPEYKKMMNIKGKWQQLTEEMAALRPKALADVAMRIGFQEGWTFRYKKIFAFLKSRETDLDSLFNFAPLLMNKGTVMPPVITQADAYTEMEGKEKMVRTGLTYRILKPAKFISVEPSWRDYLLIPEGAMKVEKPNAAMLPMDSAEQLIWQTNFSTGWLEGMEYADRMFETGVNRLVIDMKGLVQYRLLERAGYISMPQIARGHVDIRVGDQNLEFDQEIFRITQQSKFKKANSHK